MIMNFEKDIVLESVSPYVGVPAPVYLKDDIWFGPAVRSQKQLDYMEQERVIKEQEKELESVEIESVDIHQLMYDIATESSSTTLHIDPIGGSENLQYTYE